MSTNKLRSQRMDKGIQVSQKRSALNLKKKLADRTETKERYFLDDTRKRIEKSFTNSGTNVHHTREKV